MKHGHRWFVMALVLVTLVAAAFALWGLPARAVQALGNTIYVDADATGANDGTSWEDAYTTLQPALEEAEDGDEIWVAAGTYTPTYESSPGDPRSATFQLKNGVALYGGFDPTLGDVGWEDRDWVTNVAVLSGDIGIQGDPADNSYHVFYHPAELALDGSAGLDGFTVSGGNANGSSYPNTRGGGMYNSFSSPVVTHCIFSGNSAISGGGMYNSFSSPVVTHCTFSNNSAYHLGGGMMNSSSTSAVSNCTFSGNSTYQGGGMYNHDSPAAVTNCAFLSNSAYQGGGIYSHGTSAPTVTNCTFSGNSASGAGGAMASLIYTHPEDNGNSGRPASRSVGTYSYFGVSHVVTNSILWGDSPDEVKDFGFESIVTHSDIQGGSEGAGNIDADPLFVDSGNGDYHLGPDSPCMDAGTNDAPDLPDYDFEGDPRVMDGNRDGVAVVDMGVDEVLPLTVIYVDRDAVGANNGTSWDDAYTALQPALDDAAEGDEIWVAKGTYTPTYLSSPGDPRSATFQLKNGVALYGGFDPSVGDVGWEDRDWVNNVTILSGNIGDLDTADDNSYHVFYHPPELALDGTAILDGFTVSGGNANGAEEPNFLGGGMCNSGSSPQISNCTFSGNSAGIAGGGIYNEYSSLLVSNCTFSGNSATYGGGMDSHASSPVVTDCTFSGNQADQYGGGVFNVESSSALTNCTFSGNSAITGGAMSSFGSSPPTITNCTFSGNSAGVYGGGLWNYESSPVLTSCILWGNIPNEISNDDSHPIVTYSDIQGGYPGQGNIDADPLFVDPGGGDYHLGPGSPCIDAGTNDAPNLPEFDFEGDTRVMDGNRDGTAIVDMGVDEVVGGYGVYLPLVLRYY